MARNVHNKPPDHDDLFKNYTCLYSQINSPIRQHTPPNFPRLFYILTPIASLADARLKRAPLHPRQQHGKTKKRLMAIISPLIIIIAAAAAAARNAPLVGLGNACNEQAACAAGLGAQKSHVSSGAEPCCWHSKGLHVLQGSPGLLRQELTHGAFVLLLPGAAGHVDQGPTRRKEPETVSQQAPLQPPQSTRAAATIIEASGNPIATAMTIMMGS